MTDQLSMEAFYQLEWDQTIVDNCGTFFGNDVVADGCDDNYAIGNAAILPLEPFAAAAGVGFDVTSEGVITPRSGDRDARDSGQFGVAFRWLADAAEYGVYFMNYHSRTPVVSTTTSNISLADAAAIGGVLAGAGMPTSLAGGILQSAALGNGSYYLEYPEDIRLYGASFSTTLPTGTAWSGEISYRPNAPVQINTYDLTRAMLNPIAGGVASPVQTSPGADNRGYNRKEITQIQTLSLIHI